MQPLLTTEHLTVRYARRSGGFWSKPSGFVSAVEDVSLTIARGETMGLVGESGSGKTTLGLAILRALEPEAGRIELSLPDRTLDVTALSKRELRDARRYMQMIFQDPYSSLNPRMTVRDIISEPLIAQGLGLSRKDRDARVIDIAEKCRLTREQLRRYPHAFSGGQRRGGSPRTGPQSSSSSATSRSRRSTSRSRRRFEPLASLQQTLGLTYFIAHNRRRRLCLRPVAVCISVASWKSALPGTSISPRSILIPRR